MTRINGRLKCIFMLFNLFFAIVGGVIIGLAVLAQAFTSDERKGNLEGHTSGLLVLYIMGIVTMVISIVGIYGAHKEHKTSLVVFQASMIIGGFLMFLTGIPEAINRPKMEAKLEEEFREILPLDRAGTTIRQMLNTLQYHMHCCGLFSYKDWEDNIPESCVCSEMEEEEYQCREVNYRDLFQMKTKSIYSKPCFPIIKDYVLMAVDIGLGVVFFLAALAVLGIIMSSVIIHQLCPPQRSSVLLAKNEEEFHFLKGENNQFVLLPPCFPIIEHYVLMAVDIGLGVVFFLAALAGISIILVSVMIYQICHRKKPAVLLGISTISTSGPPKHQKLLS